MPERQSGVSKNITSEHPQLPVDTSEKEHIITMKLDLWKNGIIISCSLAVVVQGFSSNNVETTTTASTFTSTSTTVSRRSLLQDLIAVPAVATAGLLLSSPVEPAQASGGATAGGAYLLSAKQRYNDRVTKAVKGLLEAGAALAEGNSKAAKAYFGNEEVGSWKDLTAAGYLLSNAFRRSSTTAPDR